MQDVKKILQYGLVAGSCASVLSAAALAVFGRREDGEPLGPINAVSHWLWGDPALQENRPTVRHTLVGYAIHHGASILWGTVHMWAWNRRQRMRRTAGSQAQHGQVESPVQARLQTEDVAPLAAHSVATAALACFVDFQLTPHRLTPGFEHRLNHQQLAGVYGAFAVGLALSTWALSRRR